jgi:hypothetical protein
MLAGLWPPVLPIKTLGTIPFGWRYRNMADYLNTSQLYDWATGWIRSNVLIATNAEQLATVAAIFVCFLFLVRPLNRFSIGMAERFSVRAVRQILI